MNLVQIKKMPASNYEMEESMNVLRTNLTYSAAEKKVILLTSANENDGKTTVAFQLALNFARAGQKVLLVDADLRKSVFAGTYGISRADLRPMPGFSDLLAGNATIDEVVYDTDQENLNLVLSGHMVLNPTPLFGTRIFTAFLEKVRAEYDCVIIDSPPLGRVIDSAVIAPLCDGTVIVLNYGETTYDNLNAVKKQFLMVNAKILGCVLNKAEHEKSGYYSKYYKKGGAYAAYGKKA